MSDALSNLNDSNPLLQPSNMLPPFSRIDIAQIEPALDDLLADNRRLIAGLLENIDSVSWDTLLAPLEQWNDRLERFWSPISHLNGVQNSEALREVYTRCLPKLSEYGTELGQNEDLYRLFKQLADSEEYPTLSRAQRKAIDNELRDFKLSGIALNTADRQRFADIKKQLSKLSTSFSNNVLDATQGWSKHITDEGELAGLPDSARALYRQLAQAKELSGWLITLDIPAYLPAMQYADSRELREELYRAYSTRASDQGPAAGQWDNSDIIDETLTLRHELAGLLDFDSYAEYSLATKMAESVPQVMEFLQGLAQQSLAVATADFAELEAFARGQGLSELAVWDVPYYSEKLRLEKYDLSQEELRPYFPANKVISGMFSVVKRLFAIDIEAVQDFDSWHPDVSFYQIKKDGEHIASFYLDLFAREHKRGGAWMADCRVRCRDELGNMQLPVAFLTCNFTQPTADSPSLLTHNEVTTLFHEFGHGLHHMLTEIDVASVSGINGVAWDAVELPSQFLENWCWEVEAIALISGHYKTGELLPDAMLKKMLAAKNFQSGMMMMRQLEFSLFDFSLHSRQPAEGLVKKVLDEVRAKTAVYSVPEFNRFQHGFSHIFAGGYAAGYFSYKWAEVLSADAFSSFEEEGVFNTDTGNRFLHEILQQGGSAEAMALFVAFRGRKPEVTALLRHSGIVSEEVAS